MLKKTALLSVVFMLAIMLSGCFPDGSSPYLGNSGQISDARQLAESIENFELDLTLPQNSPEELPVLELSIRQWDTEKVLEMFMGDKEITDRREFDSDYYDGEKYSVYWADDVMFVIEKGRLSYTRLSGTRERSLCSFLDIYYESEPYDVECSFMTREEAVGKVREILDKLGITNLSEPDVRGVDVPLAEKLLKKSSPSGNYEPWGDDEFYYITFSQVYEDIPINRWNVRGLENKYVSKESYITAIVDKNGIVELSLSGIYSAEYKQGDKVSVTSASDALTTAVSNMAETDFPKLCTMYDCKLIYVNTANDKNISFTFAPVWEFSYCCCYDSGNFAYAADNRTIERSYVDYKNNFLKEY